MAKTITNLVKLLIKYIRLAAYPVGSVYTSSKPTSPAELFGGTWKAIEDVFLYCASPKHAAGETGGAETHTLTVDEVPAHAHRYTRMPQSYSNTNFNINDQANFNESVRKASNSETVNTEATGGGSRSQSCRRTRLIMPGSAQRNFCLGGVC